MTNTNHKKEKLNKLIYGDPYTMNPYLFGAGHPSPIPRQSGKSMLTRDLIAILMEQAEQEKLEKVIEENDNLVVTMINDAYNHTFDSHKIKEAKQEKIRNSHRPKTLHGNGLDYLAEAAFGVSSGKKSSCVVGDTYNPATTPVCDSQDAAHSVYGSGITRMGVWDTTKQIEGEEPLQPCGIELIGKPKDTTFYIYDLPRPSINQHPTIKKEKIYEIGGDVADDMLCSHTKVSCQTKDETVLYSDLTEEDKAIQTDATKALLKFVTNGYVRMNHGVKKGIHAFINVLAELGHPYTMKSEKIEDEVVYEFTTKPFYDDRFPNIDGSMQYIRIK